MQACILALLHRCHTSISLISLALFADTVLQHNRSATSRKLARVLLTDAGVSDVWDRLQREKSGEMEELCDVISAETCVREELCDVICAESCVREELCDCESLCKRVREDEVQVMGCDEQVWPCHILHQSCGEQVLSRHTPHQSCDDETVDCDELMASVELLSSQSACKQSSCDTSHHHNQSCRVTSHHVNESCDAHKNIEDVMLMTVEHCSDQEDNLQCSAVLICDDWLNGVSDSHVTRQLFTILPTTQVVLLLEMVCESREWTEVGVSTACQSIMSLSQSVCLSTCTVFVQLFILVSIQKLKKPASRLFVSTLVSFTKVYPLSIIEALIRPLLTSTFSDVHQTDVLVKIIKEALTAQQQITVLNLSCNEACDWSDCTFVVLQSVVELQTDLPERTLGSLLIRVQALSTQHSRDLKFTKLLLTIVNMFVHKLTASQVDMFRESVAVNKTFLKKQITAALNNIHNDLT